MAPRKSTPKAAATSTAKPKSRTWNLRFNSKHFARAEELAKRRGVTVSAIIQMALAEKLEREGQ
jgi:predicted HicB family RNase H-like nuclease